MGSHTHGHTRTHSHSCITAVQLNPSIRLSPNHNLLVIRHMGLGEPHFPDPMFKVMLITVSVFHLFLPEVPHENKYEGVDEHTHTPTHAHSSTGCQGGPSRNNFPHCHGDVFLQ